MQSLCAPGTAVGAEHAAESTGTECLPPGVLHSMNIYIVGRRAITTETTLNTVLGSGECSEGEKEQGKGRAKPEEFFSRKLNRDPSVEVP